MKNEYLYRVLEGLKIIASLDIKEQDFIWSLAKIIGELEDARDKYEQSLKELLKYVKTDDKGVPVIIRALSGIVDYDFDSKKNREQYIKEFEELKRQEVKSDKIKADDLKKIHGITATILVDIRHIIFK